jgi:nucleotide sugar dehydrogenase
LALRAEQYGHSVIGIDTNSNLVLDLQQHRPPSFLTPPEQEQITEHKLTISKNASLVSLANAVIICVPTPVTKDHKPDLGPVISAAEAIAPFLSKQVLVVVESTVNPGVCEEKILPILEKGSSLTVERNLFFAHCPERINPGDEKWNVHSIPRVLGASGEKSAQRALDLYRTLIEAPIHKMETIREAEAVKMVENTFRDINIAFVNELAMSFQKLDIDVVNVIRGASTKPFGFMAHYPGCGVGGHCIPVDPYYLITYAQENGFSHKFLELARTINNKMPQYTITLLKRALREHGMELPGAHIALLGLAYKRNVPDLRESPALVIERELIKQGVLVKSYDPLVPSHSLAKNMAEALSDVDAAVIATDHDAFRSLTPEDFLRYQVPILIDGRNCFDKKSFREAGLAYVGIGR